MAFPSKLLIYFIIILSIFIEFAISSESSDDKNFGSATVCMGNSTTTNSTYKNYDISVSSLLSQLALKSAPSNPAYFSTSIGKGRDKAYGSYICWGDISRELCDKCVLHTTQALLKQDFYQDCLGTGYFLDSDICLVHYANYSVTDYKKKSIFAMGNLGVKVDNYLPYNRTLMSTIDGLIKEAKFGNWTTTNFATRAVPVVGSNEQIHVLVQCIPVISAKNCSRCLRELYDYVPKVANGTQGGLVVHADCILKFNNQSFIGGASRSSSPSNLRLFCVLLFLVYFVIYI